MKSTHSFLSSDWQKRVSHCLVLLLASLSPLGATWAGTGASVPWTTYEAEAMTINGGVVLGPPPRAVDKNETITNTVASEASGRQCVQLSGAGQYVEFMAQGAANTMVVRYSVPDTADGTGADYTISFYLNGNFVQKIPVTSRYTWLYGGYPFSNNPGDGSPRNYFDEARLTNLSINPGDRVRLQVDSSDTASYYVIDLVDLEEIGPPLSQPAGSRSVLDYGAHGDGTNDDTVAIQNCVAGGGVIWFPPGNYVVTNDINLPSDTTIQGAGMWYTTFVGNPVMYAASQYGRVRFNGNGDNTHFADFAIVGKLTYRNDSEANDGFSNFFGYNSSISRVWVEHTKTGAWIANSVGMVITDCRFRDTIADGINLCKNCQSCIVTNCAARNTGDDSFAIWPAVYTGGGTNGYTPGWNVITHCTAQSPFFANGCGVYGAISNRVEDSFFQDIPDGCGILISGTFAVGSYVFQGITVAQRCNLNRCGGNDPGWRWRGALTLCPDTQGTISGLNVNNLNISNSLSYAVQILHNTLSNASMSEINVNTYAVAVPPYHPQDPYPNNNDYVDGVYGVYADSSANGSINVSDLSINGTNFIAVQTNIYMTDCVDQSTGFTFNFLTAPISVTVQAPGHFFSVDGVNYTNTQTFKWTQGATHTLATVSPQNNSASAQDIWTSWSDGGTMSHTVSPLSNTTYTANFTTQYYLTVTNSTGGNVSPGSGWNNSGATVTLTATPVAGYTFANWMGSGSGSYSGTSNAVAITMTGPISETASFYTPQVQSLTWIQQPTNVPQGVVIAPEIQVLALGTNDLPQAGASVTIALASGTGTLSGTLTQSTDSNGIAHFNDLSINQAGPKTLVATASAGDAPPTDSASFMIIGPPVDLAFVQQPGSAIAGSPFGQQPVLEVVDAYGTPTTSGLPANLPVQIALSNGGTLLGTTSFNMGGAGSNGVVAFSNLEIDTAGTVQIVASTTTPAANLLSNAVLWLDANDSSTLTTNGTRVQAWKNKGTAGAGVSGTNLWFTQSTVSLQPWFTNTLNGKPVLTFNKNGSGYGAGCTYIGNIGKSSYANSGSQMTYFAVARQWEDSIGWQGPVSFSRSGQTDGQGTAGVVVLGDGSQSAPFPLGIQRNHPGTPMQADVPGATVGTPFVMSFDDNAGAASLYVTPSGGTSVSNGATIVNGISPYTYSVTDVTIGGRLEPSPGTVDNGWDGDIAEVLAFNTALNSADRASVQSYLTNKWFSPNGGLVLSSALSQAFTVQSSNSVPPEQSIQSATVNSDDSVTLTYATTPGFTYHIEMTTNLASGNWTTVAGSVTNAAGNSVTFTDFNSTPSAQRYYRSVSP